MEKIIPQKLGPGNEIRVIAPSLSLRTIPKPEQQLAKLRLTELGYTVTFGKNVNNAGPLDSTSIEERVLDLENAFQDKNVKMVLCATGGYNVNQLLPEIDFDLIKNNPKIICGFSDITALTNAIYTKTGLVTYAGPNFSSFGMEKGFEYSKDMFQVCLNGNTPLVISPSKEWGSDNWRKDQKNRTFEKNEGPWIIQEGKTNGTLVGGNLCTLNLLQGTMWMPKLEGSIVCIEDDPLLEDFDKEFERNLVSLLQQKNADKIKGLLIGRFQKTCGMTKEKLQTIIQTKKQLQNIPIIANLDFGHTTPRFTFPIGGTIEVVAEENTTALTLTTY